ncbi:MAG: hypothetical protein AB7V27_04580 [Candidatus Binatia bacterium]
MRTVNAKARAMRGSFAILAASVMLGFATSAVAQVAQSDYAAGYVVLPKVVVHTTGGTPPVLLGGVTTDTLIQITNINQAESINVHCWWVNANKHCATPTGAICETNADCVAQEAPLPCQQDWGVTNFEFTLTPGQPIGFLASEGLNPIPCSSGTCIGLASGAVLAVPEDPFRGELKCLQVSDSDEPVDQNDLKVEATIVSHDSDSDPAVTTAAAYNGVGFRSVDVGSQAATDPICLGSAPSEAPGCAGNYAPCPNVLHLEHFFENANTGLGSFATTELTLVPCSEDLGDPAASEAFSVTAQMLVYNEFEQRFSTSASVQCYKSVRLSDIDTQPGVSNDQFSIFAVGVQGTIVGQTRIKGVSNGGGRLGFGIIGVANENHSATVGGTVVSTAAFNLQHVGFRQTGDAVYRTLPGNVP